MSDHDNPQKMLTIEQVLGETIDGVLPDLATHDELGDRSKVPYQIKGATLSDLVDALRNERDALRQAMEGQGIGLTALHLLLGSPKEGLIEAVRVLMAERDEAQNEVKKLNMRVSDLKFALGTDSVGWFDRAKANERERDEARAERDQLREELARLHRLAPTGTYTVSLPHEQELQALSDSRDKWAETARKLGEQLEWSNEMACENTPTPGCECPGCETARDRARRGVAGPEDER
jgi:hypothetical protein